MRNKSFGVILITLTLSGCGMFRKTEKTKDLTQITLEQESKVHVVDRDTGSVTTTKKWFVNPPLFNGAEIKPYTLPDFVKLGTSTSEMELALQALQKENLQMFNLLKNGSFGYEEKTTEKKARTIETKEAVKTDLAQKENHSGVKKTPDTTALFIFAGISILTLIIAVFILIWLKKHNN